MADSKLEASPVDIGIQQFNQAADETDAIRETLINRLAAQVPDVSREDNARLIEVKMGMYKTLDDLLKSKESSKANRVKVLLQQKTIESTANYQDAVIALLEQIDPTKYHQGDSTVSEDIDQVLEEQFKASAEKPLEPGESVVE